MLAHEQIKMAKVQDKKTSCGFKSRKSLKLRHSGQVRDSGPHDMDHRRGSSRAARPGAQLQHAAQPSSHSVGVMAACAPRAFRTPASRRQCPTTLSLGLCGMGHKKFRNRCPSWEGGQSRGSTHILKPPRHMQLACACTRQKVRCHCDAAISGFNCHPTLVAPAPQRRPAPPRLGGGETRMSGAA